MKKWLKRLGALVAVVVVAAAGFLVPTIWFKPWVIDHFYMRILLEVAIEDPLLVTQLKLLEAAGLDFHADDLPTMTMAQRERMRDIVNSQKEILASYDTSGMNDDERLSHEMMTWLLTRWAEAADRFLNHAYAVDQLQGLHVRFPDVMVNYHLISKPSDAENYIKRVDKIGGALDDVVTTAKTLEKDGYTIPSFILEKIHGDAKAFADKPVAENALFVDFGKKVEKLEISEDDKKRLVSTLETSLTESAIPGYTRFADEMQKMSTRTSSDAGVWHLPDGAAYYENRIQDATTTTLTADEIHAIGLREVARIQAEMTAILDAQNIEGDTFRARLEALSADPRFHWPEGEEGRKAILAEYRRLIDDINSKLEPMFATDPKAPVNVDPVPKFKEETAPFAYYFPAALDGSKPGTFYANLRDLKAHKKFGMRTLTYHEAVPGHHFQLSIARAQKHLPLIRQLIPLNAFGEGWALYAEQLAAENGFVDDPFDRIGYLDAQLFRAVRLVVDTGLHSKRWSRQKAIDYMTTNTGSEKSDIEAEIDRYCVWPGQALGYMIGRLRFLELRDRAKKALGDDFDIRGFHDAVLLQGALPLDLLSAQVDAWIAKKKKKKS